jgi:diguanylate cyclase (GGDEF)-like protein
MAYGRSKLLMQADPVLEMEPAAASHHATVFNIVPTRHEVRAPMLEAERLELENLRSINARLLRELAALRLREAEALRLADRDGLTGLFNRRRMFELLESAIQDAARQRQYVGVLFVDLNGFKAVNDEYGHAAGDRILTTVATRISARVRIGDIVCRYGGDEFVVVLPSIPEAGAVSRVADTIRERVALPYWINGQEQHLSAAIGESLYPHDGDDAATLLNRADKAMYRLKARAQRPGFNLRPLKHPEHARRRNDKSKSRSGCL